ncbi:MFS transporter [Streptomyces sp. PRKS01-65]|nr:MFS transporter [Streptomyces harenosi]NEY35726.1 MFS transporter [Streptomyces harenosi]
MTASPVSPPVSTAGRPAVWALAAAVTVPQLGYNMAAPALPLIARSLAVPLGSTQLVITLYLAGYALSMLCAGTLATRYGARRLQIWGLGLFVAASAVCAAAPALEVLVAARFLQALGGCSATVLTRLVIQEEYTEDRRMRVLTTLAAAIALTPLLAPVLGGALTEAAGWRGVFAAMALLGAGTLALFHACAPGGAATGAPVRVRAVLRDYTQCLGDRSFVGYAACLALVSMAHVVFVSYSSYTLQAGMGVSPAGYGVLLGVSAVGYVAGTMAARRLSERHDIDRILWLSALVCAAGGLAGAAAVWARPGSPAVLMCGVTVVMAGVGATVPATQAGLLRIPLARPGNASGLFFFVQLMTGTVYSLAAAHWVHTSAVSLAVAVAVPCAVYPAFLLVLTTPRRRRRGDQEGAQERSC